MPTAKPTFVRRLWEQAGMTVRTSAVAAIVTNHFENMSHAPALIPSKADVVVEPKAFALKSPDGPQPVV
jgi:hypothetical protein